MSRTNHKLATEADGLSTKPHIAIKGRLLAGASVLAITSVLAFNPPATAQEANWSGAAGQNWSTPGSWDTGAVPSVGDVVTIDLIDGPVITTSDAVAAEVSVGMNAEGTLTILSGGHLTTGAGGAIGFWAAGAVTVDGANARWSVGDAQLIVGALSEGTLTIANGGEVSGVQSLVLGLSPIGRGTVIIGSALGEDAAQAGKLTADEIIFGTGGGQIVFNHSDADFDLASTVSGNGNILHVVGTTKLTGDGSGFTGTAGIVGGNLLVDGSFGGSFLVGGVGTLGGTGSIGDTLIGTGGTLAPGNGGIGTLNVAGNLVFESGSIFAVDAGVQSAGADFVNVAGTVTIGGGNVVVTALGAETDYLSGQGHTHTILTAAGGRTGEFENDEVFQVSYFLDGKLAYQGDDVVLTIGRNLDDEPPTEEPPTEEPPTEEPPTEEPPTEEPPTEEPPTEEPPTEAPVFEPEASTPNQRAVAQALDSDAPTAVQNAVLNVQSQAAAQDAFEQLSGEGHASTQTALIEDSRFVRDAVNERLRAAPRGGGASAGGASYGPEGAMRLGATGSGEAPVATADFGLWTSVFGAWGEIDGNGNASKLDRTTAGFLLGGDGLVLDTWRIGALAGWSRSSVDAFRTSTDVDSYHLGAYAGREWGALALRTGLAYTWHDVESDRSVAFGNLNNSLEAEYDADTFQAFGELGLQLGTSSFGFEPFANVAYVSLETDAFTEDGGVARLAVAGGEVDTTFTTLGIRVSSGFRFGSTAAVARGTVGWRHAFGDTTPFSLHAFTSGDAFTVAGVPIAKDVVVLEAGFDFQISEAGTLGFSYTGQHGSDASENGVNARLNLKF